MSRSLDFILTNIGRQRAWNNTRTGISLDISHVEIGTGYKEPNATEINLVTPKQYVPIAAGWDITPTQSRLSAIFKGELPPFEIKELGLWCGEPRKEGSFLAFYWSSADGVALQAKYPGVDFAFNHELAFGSVLPAGSLKIVVDNSQSLLLAMLQQHAKEANPHSQYLLSSGGVMTGSVIFNKSLDGIKWMTNTDGAEIFFKSEGDGDTDSYLEYRTLDNGNEYHRWTHRTGTTAKELMRLVPNDSVNPLKLLGDKAVFHSGNVTPMFDIICPKNDQIRIGNQATDHFSSFDELLNRIKERHLFGVPLNVVVRDGEYNLPKTIFNYCKLNIEGNKNNPENCNLNIVIPDAKKQAWLEMNHSDINLSGFKINGSLNTTCYTKHGIVLNNSLLRADYETLVFNNLNNPIHSVGSYVWIDGTRFVNTTGWLAVVYAGQVALMGIDSQSNVPKNSDHYYEISFPENQIGVVSPNEKNSIHGVATFTGGRAILTDATINNVTYQCYAHDGGYISAAGLRGTATHGLFASGGGSMIAANSGGAYSTSTGAFRTSRRTVLNAHIHGVVISNTAHGYLDGIDITAGYRALFTSSQLEVRNVFATAKEPLVLTDGGKCWGHGHLKSTDPTAAAATLWEKSHLIWGWGVGGKFEGGRYGLHMGGGSRATLYAPQFINNTYQTTAVEQGLSANEFHNDYSRVVINPNVT